MNKVDGVEPLSISPADVPAWTGLGYSTVKALIAAGEIPSFKVGRRRVVPVAALREWINRRFNEAKSA